MSFCKTPIRLASKSTLAAVDVESAYAELVKVLGGTYYVNGVATGPVNGTLDYRNFARHAGFTVGSRSEPYSMSAIKTGATVGIGAVGTTYPPLLFTPSNVTDSIVVKPTLIAISVVATWSSAITGSVEVDIITNGSPSALGTWAYSKSSTSTIYQPIVTATLNTQIPVGSYLSIIYTNSTGPSTTYSTLLWFKSQHVKAST